MAWKERMCKIERNGESKLEQKLLTPASRDNGIIVVYCVYLWRSKNPFNLYLPSAPSATNTINICNSTTDQLSNYVICLMQPLLKVLPSYIWYRNYFMQLLESLPPPPRAQNNNFTLSSHIVYCAPVLSSKLE